MGPVTTCQNRFDEDGQQLKNTDPNVKSVCAGGGNDPGPGETVAYTCLDRFPWTDADGTRYAYAATNSLDTCCQCFELTFLDTSVDKGTGRPCTGCSQYQGELEGEKLIIQVINTGGDVGVSQFDLMLPGGGLGIFNGLVGLESGRNGPPLFPESDVSVWGQRYGGVDSKEACQALPDAVVAGCEWRFDALLGADNPGVSYKRVSCGLHPGLIAGSGCLLAEDAAAAGYGTN